MTPDQVNIAIYASETKTILTILFFVGVALIASLVSVAVLYSLALVDRNNLILKVRALEEKSSMNADRLLEREQKVNAQSIVIGQLGARLKEALRDKADADADGSAAATNAANEQSFLEEALQPLRAELEAMAIALQETKLQRDAFREEADRNLTEAQRNHAIRIKALDRCTVLNETIEIVTKERNALRDLTGHIDLATLTEEA